MSFRSTALAAIFFGSIYTVFRKYQSVCPLEGSPSFNQPILQSFFIFVGMSSFGLVTPFFPSSKSDTPKWVYILPSFLDVVGTIVDTTGLYYTSVSVSQMLKGSVMFFTYGITVFLLKRPLSWHKHRSMGVVLLALTILALCNVHPQKVEHQTNPILGNFLIILSQFLFSLMFIYEEKILRNYKPKVEQAVFWEGVWGTLIAGVALLIFSNLQTPIHCDFVQNCKIVYSNLNLALAIMATAFCIGPFNYFGMSLTKMDSALHRSMICTCRMVVVWIVSLGFQWEEFRWTQLLGYALLTYGIYQFGNQSPDPNHFKPVDDASQEAV